MLRRSRGEKIFGVFNTIFLVMLSLAFVIPFISIISTSLIGDEEWARRGAFILFPQKVVFGAYQLLFTGQLGYELAAKHTAYPGIGSWERADLDADQSFYDYDHPPVLIWRKTRDLTDQEWQSLFADPLQADPQRTREGDEPPVRLPIP